MPSIDRGITIPDILNQSEILQPRFTWHITPDTCLAANATPPKGIALAHNINIAPGANFQESGFKPAKVVRDGSQRSEKKYSAVA
jgi:hypothetical protein